MHGAETLSFVYGIPDVSLRSHGWLCTCASVVLKALGAVTAVDQRYSAVYLQPSTSHAGICLRL